MTRRRKNPLAKKPIPAQQNLPRQPKTITATAQTFSGPLPPPALLKEYNATIPNGAERIIAMVEAQSKHRQELELKVVSSDIENSRTGLHYGLVIGLAAVFGGVVCALAGQQAAGSIIGGTGLTGLVSVFVYGSRQRRKEREHRLEQMKK